MNAKPTPPVQLPAFFSEAPLYAPFSYGAAHIVDLLYFEGQAFDCYCPACGQPSTFRAPGYADFQRQVSARAAGVPGRAPRTAGPPSPVLIAMFACARRPDQHQLRLVVLRTGPDTFMKIGQYPSLADLAAGALSRYRRVLTAAQLREFSRGIGLAAHGIGVGAFVYFRRVFVALIEGAHRRALRDPRWNEDAYQQARHVDQKLRRLRRYLPPFLVANAQLYSILSKGLHELPEADCLRAVPAVRRGIELILDQELARLVRAETEAQARREIAELTRQHAPKRKP
jgi:hypothetical protein